MAVGIFVTTVYSALYLLLCSRYLTPTEVKDFKYAFASGIVGALVIGLPLAGAAYVNAGTVTTIDTALILTVTIAMFLMEGLFEDAFELGRNIKNVGYWRDSSVELSSVVRTMFITLVAVVILVCLFSLLLLSYAAPPASANAGGVPYLYQLSSGAAANGVAWSLVCMNLAIYATVVLFINILYVAGEVSNLRVRKSRKVI